MSGRRGLLLVLILLALGACGGSPASSPQPSAVPAATSYAEFAEGFCSALWSMTRAVGNPDTGADSDLSFALEQAIERRDLDAANEAAGKIGVELSAARQETAGIARWSEGAEVARDLDQFLAAYELYVAAMVRAAPDGMPDAQMAAQQAFEQAGALDAWFGMLQGVQALGAGSDDPTALDCGIPPDPRQPD